MVADIYAGEGGATRGLMDAGFCVTAVDSDKNRLKYNPAPHRLVGDAIDFILEHDGFVFRWTSPPCQGYSRSTVALGDRLERYDRLIAATRAALQTTQDPWLIENVEDAGPEMVDPVLYCGRMFSLSAVDTDGVGLVMDRHRLFESNFTITPPPHPVHGTEWVAGSYSGARRDKYEAKYIRKGGYVPAKSVQESLLGIDWMTQKGLYLSIPPVYAEHIGLQVQALLTNCTT